MADTYRAVIPYESLDPLTIGASGDEEKVNRDELELEIPEANLLAAIYPDEPAPVPDATEAARAALESPVAGPRFSELLACASARRDRHRQPVPPDAAVEAPPGGLRRARGRRGRRLRDLRERQGLPDVGVGHRAEDRQREPRRMERLGIPFFQNEPRNADAYTYVGVSSRGTPVWLHNEVAQRDVKITIGQAQSNHWGAGGGGKLILPGVVSDETIESNHCTLVPSPQTHYGAYAGPMRSDIDEVATMCGLDCTMNVVLDTHGRVIECIFGSHPAAHRAGDRTLQRDLRLRAPGREGRHRDLRRLRADRPPLLPYGLGLHVGRPRRPGGRHDHLLRARRRASRRRSATSPAWR